MALVDCKECGNQISDKAATCPHCGFAFITAAPPVAPTPGKSSSIWWLWVLAIPASVFLALMVIAVVDPSTGEKSDARSAIALCWDEQGRKSNAPGVARFVAGACERMESDFRVRYGVSP